MLKLDDQNISDKKVAFITNNTSESDKFNFLPPERKIRYKLFKIIDSIRLKYKLITFACVVSNEGYFFI